MNAIRNTFCSTCFDVSEMKRLATTIVVNPSTITVLASEMIHESDDPSEEFVPCLPDSSEKDVLELNNRDDNFLFCLLKHTMGEDADSNLRTNAENLAPHSSLEDVNLSLNFGPFLDKSV